MAFIKEEDCMKITWDPCLAENLWKNSLQLKWDEYFQWLEYVKDTLDKKRNAPHLINRNSIMKTPSQKSKSMKNKPKMQGLSTITNNLMNKENEICQPRMSTRRMTKLADNELQKANNEHIEEVGKVVVEVEKLNINFDGNVSTPDGHVFETEVGFKKKLDINSIPDKSVTPFANEIKSNELASKTPTAQSSKGREDKEKENENEWMTDSENEMSIEFYDAKEENTVKKQIQFKRRVSVKRTLSPKNNNRGFGKRKKGSEYFTPKQLLSTARVTRAQTRIEHKSSSITTPTSSNRVMTRTMTRSAEDVGNKDRAQKTYGSSSKMNRCIPRIDVKKLTESAAKRRQEEEEKRRIQLQQLQEKESKVMQMKEKYIQQRVMEHKQKREDKEKRRAEILQQRQKEIEEKEYLKQRKQEELERKKKFKEEQKKAESKKRLEIFQTKQAEAELKKKNEEKIRFERQELQRKKMEEVDRKRREQDRVEAMIQQHNNSLQQKANYALKKPFTSPKKMVNTTFTKNQDTYNMTPPPKPPRPPMLDNYDISQIHSDDDTDDERVPRKPIPTWAKGSIFVQALTQQYCKSRRKREKESMMIFRDVKLPVELGLIFKKGRAVAPKYEKRTSSAIWNTPPSKFLNMSINSTFSASFIDH